MSRLLRALIVGVFTAALGLLLAPTPIGQVIEEQAGHTWPFLLRGAVAPPDEVVIVSLDRRSAKRLGLPPHPRDWPRTVTADLVDRLSVQGASMIILGLTLDRPTNPGDDRHLAAAIARSGRVVLVEAVDREEVAVAGPAGTPATTLALTRILPALPGFVADARASAPFPLPKASARVNQFWTFLARDGGRPTLPAVVLQVYALSVADSWADLLAEAGVPITPAAFDAVGPAAIDRIMTATRRAFEADPGLAPRLGRLLDERADTLDPRTGRLLAALAGLYAGADSHALNHYGPPGTIPTLPVADLLAPDGGMPVDLAGKVVFVGVSETSSASPSGDTFRTVFSGRNGIDSSGIEIAATAFANLLTGTTLHAAAIPAPLIPILFGLGLGLIASLLPAQAAVPLAAVAAIAYAGLAQFLFVTDFLWLPLGVPLLLQLPIAVFGGLMWQHLATLRERRSLDRAIRLYLPEKAARHLSRPDAEPSTLNEVLFGVCLSTDAEGFTTLAESMGSRDVAQLLNEYFHVLFQPVRSRGGIITNIVGDGVMTVWAAHEPPSALRTQAVLAGIDITAAIDRFNAARASRQLRTRIGLHAGWVTVGSVGGGGHFAYTVVGDVPNTASRIEGLNKTLGTRMLASTAAIEGVDRVLCRPLGRFRLAGKASTLPVAEIVCRTDDASPRLRDLCVGFADALAAFEECRWVEAARSFEAVLAAFPEDGPAKFFLALSRRRAAEPPGSDDPTAIVIGTK